MEHAHKHAHRFAPLVLGVGLVAGTTVGCGSDSGSAAPTSASTKDFCDAYSSVLDQLRGKQPSKAEAVKGMKDWAGSMRSTGTPKDIPADARRGFGIVVDTVLKLDDNASERDIENLGDDLSDKDQADTKAFGEYATKTCGDQMTPEMPAESLSPPSNP